MASSGTNASRLAVEAAASSNDLISSGVNCDVVVLGVFVALDDLVTRDDPVQGALQTRLEAAPTAGVQELERDPLATGGPEQLDRDAGQAKRQIEVLPRARHRRAGLVFTRRRV